LGGKHGDAMPHRNDDRTTLPHIASICGIARTIGA
jgi:hypothetical protein